MRKCLTCHEEIPAARLRAVPRAQYCVEHQPDVRVMGSMTWEHKTAPVLVLQTPEQHAEFKAHSRKGVHAQLPMASKARAQRESMGTFTAGGKGEVPARRQITREVAESLVVTNAVKAVCHPDRPAIGVQRKCADCAIRWYQERSGR